VLARGGTVELTFAFYSSTLLRVETPVMSGAARSRGAAGMEFWESVCRG
jgi:hypothetical protein